MSVTRDTALAPDLLPNTTNPTLSYTVGATANVLLVGVHVKSASVTATAATYDGIAMEKVAEIASSGTVEYVAVFKLASPHTGTHNISVTLSAVPSAIATSAWSGIGADGTTPVGTVQSFESVSTTTAVPAVATEAGDLVVGFLTANSDFVVDTGSTEITTAATATNFNPELDEKPGEAGSTTMSWTQAGGFSRDYAAIVVPIKAPTATAPTAPTGVAATSNIAAPVVSWTLGTGQTSQYVHRVATGAVAPTDATTRTSADLGASATSWTDDTSPAAGTYDYYVEAANGVGSTFSTAPATATVNHAPTLAVAQPPAGNYPSGTEITCDASASDVDGDTLGAFVEVSTDGGGTYGAPVACPTTITPADGSVRLRFTSAADSGGLTATPATRDLVVGGASGNVLTLEEPMQFVRQTGVATTLPVPCKDPATGAFLTTNVLAPGDVTISIDGAAPVVLADDANAAAWVFRNGRVQIPLSAAEVSGAYVTLEIEDADGTAFIAPPVDIEVVAYDPAAAPATAPTNFSALAITGAGAVTAGTVADKTGYGLAADQSAVTVGFVTEATALGAQAKLDVTAAVPAATAIRAEMEGAGTTLTTAAADAAAARTAAEGAATRADVPTAAQNAAAVRDVFGLASSVADTAPTASSFIGAAGLSAEDDFYQGMFLVFDGGTLDGVGQKVKGYVGATRTFTVAPAFPATPANGDPFLLIGRG